MDAPAPMPAPRRPSRWSVGTLVPAALAVGLLADGGSRFVSYDRVTFRAWEAVQRNGPTGLGGPFEPDKRYRSDHAYGVLASMGNQPALRQYRTEVFTTDGYGFRNPSPAGEPPVGLLVGSSFSAGCSLSDDETLAARLGPLVGGTVYNATGLDVADEARLAQTLDRLGPAGGVLVGEYLESYTPATFAAPRPAARPLRARVEAALGPRAREVRIGAARIKGWLSVSPLEVELRRARRAIEDDTLLPNSFAPAVVREELANGTPILFLPVEIALAETVRPTRPAVAYWRWLADRLASHHLRLLVVLVPTQYTVYGPLVRHPRPGLERDRYLDELEQGLREAGVPVVNLTAPLRSAARAGLPEGRYVYWRDDNHWNADGVALAAREIAARWRETFTSAGEPRGILPAAASGGAGSQ